MKTKKELMVEIKWELAVGKYMTYYPEYLALGKEFCATMSFQDYCTIKYGSWPEDSFNGTRRRLKEDMVEEQRDPLVAHAHSHVEERASCHDEEVSIEEDQVVVYDEIVDTSMLTGFITSTNDEEATSCPTYVDYEDDDMTTPHAPLALSNEVHDTNTFDR
jgi:hypothetical protein